MRKVLALAALLSIGSFGIALPAVSSLPPPQQGGARRAPATDNFASVGDARLRYRQAGVGEAVVLLHGFGGQLEDLGPLADRLPSTNSVIAIDARGFGKSTKSADASHYGPKMADDLVGVLDVLKVTKAHVVGHSMGALIAASAVARHPARFHTATLIAGPFYPDAATARQDLAPWLADLEGGRGMGAFLRWLFPGVPPGGADAMSAGMLAANDLPSLIAVMRALPLLAGSASRISGVPAVVIAGSNDPLLPNNRAFVARSAGVQFLEVAGADHVSVGGSPKTLTAMVDLIRTKTLR